MSSKIQKKQVVSKQSPTSKVPPKQSVAKQTLPGQSLLHLLRNEINFLSIFTTGQLQYLHQNFETIVFSRGTTLTKEKEVIDYVGVILNGGALGQNSKTKFQKGSFIGNVVAMNISDMHKHCENIIAQSDGIIFCIRIQKLIATLPSSPLIQTQVKSKILNYLSIECLNQLKHHQSSTVNNLITRTQIESQFQPIIDEKLLSKLYQSSKPLTQLLELMNNDLKERAKLLQQFPIFCAKQKTLIRSKHQGSEYFMIVLKGQVIVKYQGGHRGGSTREQSYSTNKIIDANTGLYNTQGYIYGYNEYANLYCLSSQTVFMIIDKPRVTNNLKLLTQSTILKFCLESQIKINEYQQLNVKKIQEKQNKGLDDQMWSPFRKPYKVEELPTKKSTKPTQPTNMPIVSKKKDSINTFQTLYQYFLNSSSTGLTKQKLKLNNTTMMTEGSMRNRTEGESPTKINKNGNNADDKGERVGTLRTEYSVNSEGQQYAKNTGNQKVKKMEAEMYSLRQQNRQLMQQAKSNKLDLLQSTCRLKMSYVFKQIQCLYEIKNGSHRQKQQNQEGKDAKTVTLKQAFEEHLKTKKIELLVAKCAYKWLQITRKNREKRESKPQHITSTSSLHKE